MRKILITGGAGFIGSALVRYIINETSDAVVVVDTLTHWHTNARLLQQMMSWWLNTPPQNNEITLPNTFSQSLYDVLMHQRNLAWRDKLRAMPPGRYVVAVGALHLYGEGNLPQMLR